MFTKSGMNNTHVEKNLGSVCDVVEFFQRILKFIVVVSAQGRYPRLYFLYRVSEELVLPLRHHCFRLLTCFKDIVPASRAGRGSFLKLFCLVDTSLKSFQRLQGCVVRSWFNQSRERADLESSRRLKRRGFG